MQHKNIVLHPPVPESTIDIQWETVETVNTVSGINTINLESSVDIIPHLKSMYSNIIVNGLIIHGKQDNGAELNAMPRCIYARLAETDGIPVEPFTNTWITDVVDGKPILGLDFCRTFQLISVHCDSNCPVKLM